MENDLLSLEFVHRILANIKTTRNVKTKSEFDYLHLIIQS